MSSTSSTVDVVEPEVLPPERVEQSGSGPETDSDGGPPSRRVVDPDRRRFVRAAVAGVAVVTPLYLWVLWDLWGGTADVVRHVAPANFYALQARAMLHGHLYLPKNSLGIEAFLHDGHQYTYFGLFPSLIRIPYVLLVSQTYYMDFTPFALLAAWLMTAVAAAMLLWRLRMVLRGPVALGRGEAVSYGVLMATICGGSVLVELAASPFVYNEDFAWSVALTTASLLALLGMIERASWRGVASCAVLVTCTNLDRTPTGYATVIGALLVAAWLRTGKAGEQARRFALPLALVGIGALAVNAGVTYVKFGLPFGLPMADQVWAHLNAHRRYFLKANGGKAFSFAFLPSTLLAYFDPLSLHVSSVFPFFSRPASPARALGVVLDETYRTTSYPASMPLLFLLALWGVVTAFRPRPLPGATGLRLLLLTATAGGAGVVLWGYIADRYMADMLPFFILASGIGLIDVWRRLSARPRRFRLPGIGALGALAVFGVAVNVAIASGQSLQFTRAQTYRLVSAEHSLTPGALAGQVRHGTTLPYYAPAGTVFAMDNCSGLYLSTGERFANVPGQQLEHSTWLPVEQAGPLNHAIDVQFNQLPDAMSGPVTILSFGRSTLQLVHVGGDRVRVEVHHLGAKNVDFPTTKGWTFTVQKFGIYRFEVMTDPNLQSIVVDWFGTKYLGHYLPGRGPAVVHTTPNPLNPALRPPVAVTDVTPKAPSMALCRTLLRSAEHR